MDPIIWPPIMHDALYWTRYAEYVARYGYWWAQQHQTELIAGGIAGVTGLVGLGVGWHRLTTPRLRDGWGSARWATTSQIEHAGLFHRGPGIILGRHGPWYRRRTLCSADDMHAAVFGPTGSLKTWGLVIPTILNWAGSILCLDIKGVLHKWTSGYRSLLGPVYRFNPLRQGHRIDPLAMNRATSEMADDQRLAGALTADPDAKPDQRAEYWRDQVTDWLITVFRYARRQSAFMNTLAGVLGFLRRSADRGARLTEMCQCPDAEVQDGAQRLLSMRTTRGRIDEIWDGAIRVLSLWRDPYVADATSRLDIPFDQLQQGASPSTVYLQVTDDDLRTRFRSLFRVILELIVARLMERDPHAYIHDLLIVLDEVASLGFMAIIESLCRLAREYGIRLVLAYQSLNQLWQAHGHNTAIMDNCPIRVIYAPGNQETAESLSAMLGDSTVEDVSYRRSGDRLAVMYGDAGVQLSSHRRPLMTAGELMDMPKTRGVLRVTNTEYGLKPIDIYKLQYKDPEFRGKLLPEVA
jgi:type IV secretion system protein VirD4